MQPNRFAFAFSSFSPCVRGLSPLRTSSIPANRSNGKRARRVFKCCDGRVPGPEAPLLEMRNINYQVPMNFELQLFRDMNFKVFPGEFVIVVGENGAGKSTALNLMIGLTQVDRGKGQLHWRGEVTKPSRMINNIGVVMQNPVNYFLTPTVLDELVMGRETKTPDDVRRVLSAVGLMDVSLMAHPKSLSGGQVRRLAIASQLMREPLPPLFVLDEPLAGVDWTARRDIIKLLGSLKSQFAVIIVSHEPGDLLEYADRVVEVSRGGMHDIDRTIINKAIEVRARRKAEKRAQVFEDAARYKKEQSLEKPVP